MNSHVSRAAILAALARTTGVVLDDVTAPIDWTGIDTKVKHEGKQIILPSEPGKMDYDDAIGILGRIRDEENQEFDVHEHVDGAPWDCAVAVYRAMQDIYGVVISESIQTFFGEIRPDFLSVKTGASESDVIQVPIGQVSLPGVENPLQIKLRPGGICIDTTVRKRSRAVIVEIARRARQMLREQSVYKGKSIAYEVDTAGNLQINVQPTFLDLTYVSEADMIHNPETEALIKTAIFSPLKNTDACRKNRIPLKRGILLEGRYGTGKSLTARVTAKVANDNGWTFITLNRANGLKSAIEFAKNYQPCVIFVEDIDRAADRANESVNDLVNTLDGILTKDMEMMVVLTTNHIDQIDQSLLRPGRFDAVISILPPDGPTAERIIRMYARDLLDAGADLSSVHQHVTGNIPAMLREVVERAKLSMLGEGRTHLTSEDLRVSAMGMAHHMRLLAPKEKDASAAARFTQAFGELLVGAALGEDLDKVATGEHLETVHGNLLGSLSDVINRIADVRTLAKGAAASSEQASKKASEILTEIQS